jgi:hypothetical protein
VKARAIFWGAIVSQLTIFYIFYLDIVSFLWLNFIGALLTTTFSILFQFLLLDKNKKQGD